MTPERPIISNNEVLSGARAKASLWLGPFANVPPSHNNQRHVNPATLLIFSFFQIYSSSKTMKRRCK